MFKILLATDGSKFSQAATQAVIAQAIPGTTQVRVVHIVDFLDDLFPEMTEYCVDTGKIRDSRRQSAEDLVDRTAQLLRANGLKVTTRVEWGDPRFKIIKHATSWKADLIVVGSHGRTELRRLLMGSVSDAVLRHAHCSVELVRIPREGARAFAALTDKKIVKALLAIDDSKFSVAAVQALIAQCRPQNTEVRVLHVLELSASFGYPVPVSRGERMRGKELVDRIARTLAAAGFKADTILVKGDTRAGIIDCAQDWHANLIVLGSHGRSGLKRFLFGSTSEAVVHHAPCSVEVVRLRSKT